MGWFIEDVEFEATTFPSPVANFSGPPNGAAAAANVAVQSGTYNSPVIDWAALGITSGVFQITRTVTDSCGQSATFESENFSI